MSIAQDEDLDRAERLMQDNQYADAVRLLSRKVKRAPENTSLNERLGYAHMQLHQFEEAEIYYERAELLSGLSDQGMIYYGQVLFKNGKQEEARQVIERFAKHQPNSFTAQLILRSISRVGEWKSSPQGYAVNPVADLNSKYAEFAPVPFKDGVVFATARLIDHINETGSSFNNDPYLAVYYAEKKQNAIPSINGAIESFRRPKIFLRNLIGDYNIGPVAIDTTHDKIYYTIANSELGLDGVSHLQIIEADMIKDKRIQNERRLFYGDTFSAAHPTISSDGSFMIYASDRKGSTGSMDLFYAEKTDSLGWTEPMPLSALINTPLNEVFPYLKNDSTLYFASDGHPGYGGLDVFVSNKKGNKWTQPLNLKSPLNSSKDDFGICFTNSTAGYFSSSRDGGSGKDDIYSFVEIAQPADSSRVEVSGIFQYDDLPSDGIELSLLDENDNILETVRTDSTGRFKFSQLPIGTSYKIRMVEANDDMMLNADIFITNDEGKAVLALERGEQATFVFKTLPKDQIAALTPLEEVDLAEDNSYDLFGQLFSALPKDAANVEMVAENDHGRIVATTMTDSNGYYKFYDLSKAEHISISPSANDSVEYRSSVFFADANATQRLSEDGNAYFTYLFKIDAPKKTIQTPVRYTGFLKYRDVPVEGIPVVVFDAEENVIEVVRTNARGGFDLYETSPNSSYRIVLPDSFRQRTEQPKVYLIDKSTNRIINTEALNFSTYLFVSLPAIESELTPNELAYFNAPYEIKGQVFEKLPGDYQEGMTILVYDENGNLVEEATVDSNGNFVFSKLRPDQTYLFEPQVSDQGNFQLVVYDESGKASQNLRFSELQTYMYTQLQMEQVSRLEGLKEEDQPMKPLDNFIAGQIYNKLPGDYKSGIMIYAIDEKGNVLDSTLTDGKGNFKFTRLGAAEDFSIKVMDEQENAELKVALFNYDGSFLGLLFLDAENAFKYSKILLEAASDLGNLSASDNSQGLMFGQVYRELPGDYDKNLKIYAFDEDGNLMDVAQLDQDGKFKFSKLDQESNYVFRITEDDTEFNIALMDKAGNILDRLHVFNGQWTYDKLAYEDYEMKLIVERDATNAQLSYESKFKVEEEKEEKEVVEEPIAKVEKKPETKPIDKPVDKPTVKPSQKPVDKPEKDPIKAASFDPTGEPLYFEYRSADLNQNQKAKLKGLYQSWKSKPNMVVSIQSHADRKETDNIHSYSAERSVSVARYLNELGLPTDKMMVINWETDKPMVICNDRNPCEQSDRDKNQRSDVALNDGGVLATEPDFIVNYEFNAWRLDEDGEAVAYRLLQALKNNPEAHIRLDGFTDTWGSFSSNKRISELRVLNINNLLLSRGVSSSQIETHFHGETMPKGECILNEPCPLEYRESNRRVEIRID